MPAVCPLRLSSAHPFWLHWENGSGPCEVSFPLPAEADASSVEKAEETFGEELRLLPGFVVSAGRQWQHTLLFPYRAPVLLRGQRLAGTSPALFFSQFSRSVVSDSLRPHGPQHARPRCPSPTPGVYPNSCLSSH